MSAILERGAEWFAGHGTEKSRGTKTFSLAGKVNRTGLIEVPMGTTLGEIVFDIGGGAPDGRRIKAVQTGGPSGGCIPIRLLDLPVDYESLAQVGSIMGSGGMVVMDETACMVDVARYFLSFTQSESCGKCIACRLGTQSMLQTLEAITEGEGHAEDVDLLFDLSETVHKGALCGLGQNAPNPVLSTLTYFRDEYEAHINEKHCPAAVCDALMISPCQHTCPVGINVPKYVAAIADGDYQAAVDVHPRAQSLPLHLRPHLPPPLRDPLPSGRTRRVGVDPIAEAFCGRLVLRARTPGARPFPRTKSEKVAVVGAGPTGLSCAYFLAAMAIR